MFKVLWSIKKFMQTYIVIVFGSILNVSTVHLNGIWHLIWRYLLKPVLGGHPVLSGHYSIPRGCPLNTGFTVRAIFHSLRRDCEWDKRLGLGNPAADKSVKDLLRLVTAEQLQARLTPKQATPFFVDKLTQLYLHLDGKLRHAERAIDRFAIAPDQAYFKLAFSSGDRPGNLGQVKVPEILRFPNDDGFLFNHIWGKTLRDGDVNVFGVRRNARVEICPIRGWGSRVTWERIWRVVTCFAQLSRIWVSRICVRT